MRTFFFSLSFCFFAAAAIVAGAALTIPPSTPSEAGMSLPAISGPDREMERMLDRIAAEQAASAALVRDLRDEIGSLNEEIALREAEAALEQKEERMALEEENRRLLSDLQQAFENLRQDRAEAAEKEGEARVAGEEASRAALDRLRQTVDELRADLQDERERFEAARRAAEEAGKEEAARVAGEESSRAALEQLRQTVDELRADLKNERKRFESTSLNAGKGAKEAPPESEPEPPAAEFDDGGSVIAILGGGLFGSGENIVTSELEQAVQRALPAIVTRPSSSIIVEGHTDSQPLSRNLARQFGNNSTLSLMRAQTVADILIRAGVESSRITSVGFGGTRPIAPNRTPDGRAENRRVEIRLVPPGAMPAARTDVPEGE